MGGTCSLDQGSGDIPTKKKKKNTQGKKGKKKTTSVRQQSSALKSSASNPLTTPARETPGQKGRSPSPRVAFVTAESPSQRTSASSTPPQQRESPPTAEAAQQIQSNTIHATKTDTSYLPESDPSPPMLVDVSPPPRPPKHSMSEAPLVYPPPPPAPLPAQSSHRAQSHATRASVATPDISPIRHLDSSPMHPSSMIAPSISSPPPTAPPPPAVKIFSMAEVQRHNQRNDAWIVVRGVVYDVTSFARRHPGGSSVITDAAGTDATTTFVNNHDEQTALRALNPYEVGVVGR